MLWDYFPFIQLERSFWCCYKAFKSEFPCTKVNKCGDNFEHIFTGRNGKVPYYEHSWATKRNSTLTKKTFQCEPTRVQAKKAEALVWGEFCKFIESSKFLVELQNKVTAIHKNNDEESERGKLKAKLYGVSSQLDALAERLSMLPKTVSATPIFKQMEKLELVKKELEGGLLNIRDLNIDERLVSIETFEKFAEFAGHTIKNNPDFNIRRSLLQKFVHRVELGVDSIKIYWNLDKDYYDLMLKIKNPEKNRGFISCLNSSANFGSHSLTIGAPART